MSSTKLVNKYIPDYVPKERKWYKRDGLIDLQRPA